jgi:deoxyribose-phosphate aldolase
MNKPHQSFLNRLQDRGTTEMSLRTIASMIDHTILNPDATIDRIVHECREAKDYGFAAIIVHTCYIERVARLLEGSATRTGAPISFPFGLTSTRIKVAETRRALDDGAGEIDMVINIGAVKSGDFSFVEDDIAAVLGVCKGRVVTKVILETCLLEREEKIKVCEIARRLRADFVKTSTGFSHMGATVEDVGLMKSCCGDLMQVKAAGGISNLSSLVSMLEAGATRIGTSSSISIIGEARKKGLEKSRDWVTGKSISRR